MEIADEVFGEEFDIDRVADEELVIEFADRVAEIAPAHFESHELRGMRFLPRRFLPDRVVFWRLGSSEERPLPSTLDLMALLGSRTARDEIEDAFGNDRYRLGFRQIERTIDEVERLGPAMVVPTHCTGFRAISRFAERMPDAFVLGVVGTTYLF